jgi:hypothetical protein
MPGAPQQTGGTPSAGGKSIKLKSGKTITVED